MKRKKEQSLPITSAIPPDILCGGESLLSSAVVLNIVVLKHTEATPLVVSHSSTASTPVNADEELCYCLRSELSYILEANHTSNTLS